MRCGQVTSIPITRLIWISRGDLISIGLNMNAYPDYSRRHFLKHSSLATLGALSSNLIVAQSLAAARGRIQNRASGSAESFTPNSDTLKIAVIGCGGRGTGAASNALNADSNTMVWALADVFEDQLEASVKGLEAEFGQRIKVAPERRFVGLEAYKAAIDAADVVLLAAPPGFRPAHLKYAVEKGKHIFAEKPMAVDAPGVRSVMATVEESQKKDLSLVAGFCWRYHYPKRETFKRIHDGAIGDLRTVYTTYNTGRTAKEQAPWTRQNTKSALEWMLRRWYFFAWLSGDHIVEQAVHSIDKMSWAMKDVPPKSCIATGGRQVRTDPECGHIYDHFAVVYDYDDGAKGFHFCRQMDRCDGGVIEQFSGTKGICNVQGSNHTIIGETRWRDQSEKNNMFQTEHEELFAAIRSGKKVNDGPRMAISTMVAIMGRMAAYTGKIIHWDDALNSKQEIGPSKLSWDMNIPTPEVAMPGRTDFV
jgi:myo-inositol 2-dehydrogenase / D-chiro-inositol 1-dehydrogenase